MSIKKITLLAMLSAMSLGLFALELLIPPFPLCPAAKIGLANIVTLFMLTKSPLFTRTDCAAVIIVRCLLAALITGRVTAIAFSLCGGLTALLIMSLTQKALGNAMVISIAGAASHNLAQIGVSIAVYGLFSVLYTLPAMLIAGILCGALTGGCVLLINRNRSLGTHLASYIETYHEGEKNGKSKDRQDQLPCAKAEGGGAKRRREG